MAMTFIQRADVSSYGSTAIDITNIPNTYSHLFVEFNIRSYRPSGLDPLTLWLNNDGGFSYYYEILYGWNTADVRAGGATNSQGVFLGWTPGRYAAANTYGSGKLFIPNYASTSQYKYVSGEQGMEDNATNEVTTSQYSGMWPYNNAVTQIGIHCGGSEGFQPNSSVILWGLS